MSSIEYMDLYKNAQINKNAQYHMFTFDIVDSKNINKKVELLLLKIILEVYKFIKEIEIKESKKILVFEENFSNFVDYINPKEFGLKIEPFKLGDMVGFTIYKDSMTKKEILNIFESIKNKYNFVYPLHISDGYYETNKYEEGNNKFFRGYCIDILSNLHKPNYQKKLN